MTPWWMAQRQMGMQRVMWRATPMEMPMETENQKAIENSE
jgi:hypothetical protein